MQITAPSYNELFALANQLKARLEILESNSLSSGSTSPINHTPPPTESRPCTDFRLLPDLNRSVPIFTGHESSIVAEDWLGSVDALAAINNWPVQYRLQFVKSNHTTAARGWFMTESFCDWTDFMVKFRAVFVRSLRMSDRWNVMTERRQGETEHIADYFYDKLQLCQALNLSFDEIRDHIVLGIYSQELAVYAMSRTHSSSATLLADLQEGGRMFELRRMRNISVNPIPSGKPKKSFVKNQPSTSAPMLTTGAHEPDSGKNKIVLKKDQSTVRCYNCNTNGHISRDCPKPRKPCSVCQSTAHTRGRCPERPPESMRVEMMPTDSRQNSFVKNIYFNEISTTCLIDTGSSHVLVRVSLVEQSAATVRWTQRPLYTVGDAKQPSAVTLGETTADITIDGALGAEHPVLVVSDQSIPVDVIVGRSWLDLPHIGFYKLRDQFIIETLNAIDPSVTGHRVRGNDRNTDCVDRCRTTVALADFTIRYKFRRTSTRSETRRTISID